MFLVSEIGRVGEYAPFPIVTKRARSVFVCLFVWLSAALRDCSLNLERQLSMFEIEILLIKLRNSFEDEFQMDSVLGAAVLCIVFVLLLTLFLPHCFFHFVEKHSL